MNNNFIIWALLFFSCTNSNEIKRSIESKEWHLIGVNDSAYQANGLRLTRFYSDDIYLILKDDGRYNFITAVNKTNVDGFDGKWKINDSLLVFDFDFARFKRSKEVISYKIVKVKDNILELSSMNSNDSDNRIILVYDDNNKLKSVLKQINTQK